MGHPIVTNGGLYTIGNSHCAGGEVAAWQILSLALPIYHTVIISWFNSQFCLPVSP